jgi:hypothetical protein
MYQNTNYAILFINFAAQEESCAIVSILFSLSNLQTLPICDNVATFEGQRCQNAKLLLLFHWPTSWAARECDTLLNQGYQNAILSAPFSETCTSLRENRRLPRATGGNRRKRRPLAGRLGFVEDSFFATPLAKSCKNYVPEHQLRDTVHTFCSSRAIMCDSVYTFQLVKLTNIANMR